MDCYIYAVEKSLDSYKFNLLHNKQVFINQLKSRNLAARTIDEGAIDENGGGNFSEYVAILSGNNDLLEKAKLDKKLAVLESERQAYHRNKGNAKGKLNEKTSEIEKNNVFIGRFTKDWEYLNKVAPADAETGLRPNPLKLDGVDSDNIEILGNRLAAINQKARTEDDYMKIGTLFDFRILVRTEKSYDGDTQVLHNKFMVEGLDGIKYTYNNGYIAKEPKLAVMNFINALERIPAMIEKREKENAELSKDIPVLREIVAATWPKDSEIKQLGEELASLNRKIQLTLKPVGLHEEGKDEKVEMEKQRMVSGSDVIPDLPRQVKHVPSMVIVSPAKELKKISYCFPRHIAIPPEATQASLPQGYSKEPLFRKRQRHGGHPDKSDLVRRALVYGGNWLYVIFLPQRIALPLVCLSTYRQWNPSG